MALCDEIFSIVKQSLGGECGEGFGGSSVLLLGESGSGKRHAVEWCISQLKEAQSSLIVLRAYGRMYDTDVDCVRHLAAQVAGQLSEAPKSGASFDAGMEWLRKVLNNRFKQASAAIIVLDDFEHFCSRTRQTLLYNLFDIAQEIGVRLSIIGMSARMDVIGMLEKRIKSRFTMRHLQTFLPTTKADLVDVLMSKLRLPPGSDMKPPFVKEYNKHVEAALHWKATSWMEHLESGKAPMWFLWKCLPVAALLHDYIEAEARANSSEATPSRPGEPDAKRSRSTPEASSSLASCTNDQVRKLVLDGLAEANHIVMLALFRLHSRQSPATLTLLLHEIEQLHRSGGVMSKFDPDRYCSAFDQLVQAKFIELVRQGAGDVSEQYLPCKSLVQGDYATLVEDLENKSVAADLNLKGLSWNPLKDLPQAVKQWAKNR